MTETRQDQHTDAASDDTPRLPRHVRLRVEQEISNWFITAASARQRRQELLGSARRDVDVDLPVRAATIQWSDATGNAASRLLDDRAYVMGRRWALAIHGAVEAVREPYRDHIAEHYWGHLRSGPRPPLPPVGRTTIWRVRVALIERIARQMAPWLGHDEDD